MVKVRDGGKHSEQSDPRGDLLSLSYSLITVYLKVVGMCVLRFRGYISSPCRWGGVACPDGQLIAPQNSVANLCGEVHLEG
jgi:hypothetical protein